MKIDLRNDMSGSGFISENPRILIRDQDNKPGYPTIKLPGDSRRLGNGASYFDDRLSTRVFQTGSRPLLVEYPSMIPVESPPGLRESSVVTPNTTSSIRISTDAGSYVYSEAKANPSSSITDGYDPYAPFNESEAVVDNDESYFIIPVNIAQDTKISRSKVPAFGTEQSTGVYYFSPDAGGFRPIGTRDPVNGEVTWKHVGTVSDIVYGDRYYAQGQNQRLLTLFHSQYSHAGFAAAFADTYTGSLDTDVVARAYFTSSFASIGQPTNRHGGPSNYRLFATSSEVIRLSDYINAPFEITSIEFEISSSVNKVFDGQFTNGYPTDAYTFFMLRQSGPSISSRPNFADVSSSYREIIGFKSVLAYNSSCSYSGTTGPALGTWPVTGRTEFNVDSSYFTNYNDFAKVTEYNKSRYFVGTASVDLGKLNFDLSPKVASAAIYETYAGGTTHSSWGGSTSNLGQEYTELRSTLRIFSAKGTPRTAPDNVMIGTVAQTFPMSNYNADSRQSAKTKTPFANNTNTELIASYGYNIDVYKNSNQNSATSYLVSPEDNLIFGVNSLPSAPETSLNVSQFVDPSNTINHGGYYDYYTFTTGSWLQIPQQTTRIVVRGRYIKDQKSYYTSLPQKLNTLAVHESLHSNNPVLDQHETNQSIEYSGSLKSLYITGSLTRPHSGWPRSGSSELVEGEFTYRKVFGDVLAGTAGDMASVVRNYRISDHVERYYDSYVPDPVEMWKASGFEPIKVGQGVGSWGMLSDGDPIDNTYILKISPAGSVEPPASPAFTAIDLLFGNASGSPQFINTDWLGKFPFEPTFSGLQRRQRKNKYIVEYCLNGLTTNIASNNDDAMGYPKISVANENIITGVRLSSNSDAGTSFESVGVFGYQSIASSPANNALFGVGDSFTGMHKPCQLAVAGIVQAAIIEKPRGYKYGLISANPMSTTAVYRSTHYGHLRDMLEQRLYSTMLITKSEESSSIFAPTKTKSGISKKNLKSKVEVSPQYPVIANFRDPVHENPTLLSSNKNPLNTQSSNISIHATSSLPFFDDDTPRNRDYTENNILIAV